MLRSRLVVVLLMDNGELIKTKSFKKNKYIGDPLNAVRIFNEKEVDELVLLDISCLKKNQEPNYKKIEKIASQCQMPFCYGGGITNLNQIKRLVSIGVEKISIGSSSFHNESLITDSISLIGSQSIVVSLDIRKSKFSNRYKYIISNGKLDTKLNLVEAIRRYENLGVGELLIQSIDNDGKQNGFDRYLLSEIMDNANIPVTIAGGIKNLDEIGSINKKFGPLGIGAGSIFVFKGVHKAVLINYPNSKTKHEILKVN